VSTVVIVTGGREYKDQEKVFRTLKAIRPTVVVQGGATGADRLARAWCIEEGISCYSVEANWQAYGKAAGPMRNKEMIEAYPDAIVVAFPGGRGTEGCVKIAKYLGRIVLRVDP
jgi:hypothetical protein